MTTEEAIKALKLINLDRVHPFLSWEEMMEVRDMAIAALRAQQHRPLDQSRWEAHPVIKRRPYRIERFEEAKS